MSYLKTIQNAANLRSSTGGTIIVAVNALKSNFFSFFANQYLIKVFKNPGTFNSFMPISGKMGKGLRRTQLLHKKKSEVLFDLGGCFLSLFFVVMYILPEENSLGV